MKTKKTLLFFSLLCAASAVASTSFLMSSKDNKEIKADFIGEVADNNDKNIYSLNEVIHITPKDVIFDGGLITCENFYIIFPDGSAKNGADHVLNQVGEYTIVYVAYDNGKYIEAREKINAYQSSFSVGRDTSSTRFVDKIVCDKKNPSDGIATTLAEGDTWTFNQILDLSKLDKNTPLIKYYTYQMSERAQHLSLDASTYILRLTDVYDSNNYVEIYNQYRVMNESTGRVQQTFKAGCNGQTVVGLDDPSSARVAYVTYEGTKYNIYKGTNSFGTMVGNPHPGAHSIDDFDAKFPVDIANSDDYGYSYYYDAKKQTISCKIVVKELVTDLDAPELNTGVLFGGFTTGEVKLSIRCEDYREAVANFEITEICGIKGNDLNQEYCVDTTAPVIKLENEADNFYVAMNEEFEVSKAQAFDLNLNSDVKTEVFYNYGSENQLVVPFIDGKFTPTKPGEYSIVYSATDLFGNVGKKIIKCISTYHADNKLVKLDYAHIASGSAGSEVTFNKPIITSLNDGVYANMYAIYNNDSSYNEEIDINSPTLFLKRAGKYTIRIVYGDISCRKVEEFEFNSLASNNTYLETTYLPRYLIKGTTISLDDNKVVLCNSEDLKYGSAKVFVDVDNTGFGAQNINPNSFKVEASTSVKFKYVSNNETIFTSEEIPVVDANFADRVSPAKYFIGNIDITTSNSGFTFTTQDTSGDCEIKFINPVTKWNLEFEGTLSEGGYESFDIILEDYYHKLDNVVFRYTKSNEGYNVKIGNASYSIGEAGKTYITFNRNKNLINLGNGISAENPIPEDFDKCYITFKFNNLSDKSSVLVSKFAGQNFNNNLGDRFSPLISFASISGSRKINTEIAIKNVSVCDALSPYLIGNHTLKVFYQTSTSGEKSFASSKDGTVLDGTEDPNKTYVISLDKYGIFTFEYSYADQAISRGTSDPHKTVVSEIIYVEDYEAPVISVGSINHFTIELAELNDTVKIHDFAVTDESEYSTRVYAISPNDELITIENRKFTPDRVGDWTVVYYAVDAMGNHSVAQYTIRVK